MAEAAARLSSNWRTPCRAFVFAAAFSAASPLDAVTVTGRVEIIDKGDSKRPDASNVVVWLVRQEATTRTHQTASRVPVRYEMVSKSKKFTPGVIVIPVGTEIHFPNMDPIFHNVFSLSGANKFDLGLYKSGKSKSTIFKTPGLVRVYCNIHSQMVGYIHVMETPYHALTGSDGRFELKDVAPGRYSLKTWEAKAGEAARELVVGAAAAPPPIVLTVDARGFSPKPHLNKYGKTYTTPGSDEERY